MGSSEILIIILCILIVFGPNKIPEFLKILGKGMKDFKEAASEAKTIDNKDL
tara:strand:- start:330 stop:485 length:156 start_codon:yes stop_codon:yes gene_type:complete